MTEAVCPFQGKTVLITGASSGIGRATAECLGRLGARVLLNGRRAEVLAEVAGGFGDGKAIPVPHDLVDLDDAFAWVVELTNSWGPIDAMVHSAGTRVVLPLRMMKQKSSEREWQLHVQVPLGLLKGFRHRRPADLPGSVVLVSSVMGLVGAPLQTTYSAVKAAMGGLVRSAALELAPEKIRVNAVAPGCVETEMLSAFRATLTEEQFAGIVARHPLGLGRPEDVAEAIVFLLGARWITGTTLVVDGGYTAD